MTSKGKIFQIARDCNKNIVNTEKSGKKSMKVSGTHYDEGKSISLSYSLDMYRQTIYDAYRHGEPSAQLSFIDEAQSRSFYVEPFDSDEETIQTAYEDVSDDLLDNVVKADRQGKQKNYTAAASTHKKAGEARGVEPVPAHEESAYIQPEAISKQPEEGVKDDQPEYTGAEVTEDIHEESQEEKGAYTGEDDDFANDIKAILQGKKVFDPHQKKAVDPDISAREEGSGPVKKQTKTPTESDIEAQATDPSKNEHKIFEKISQSMRYANSYDLGSIAMEKKFDQLESDLEEDEIKKITKARKSQVEDAAVVTEEQPEAAKKKQAAGPSYKEEKLKYAEGELLTPENGGKWINTSHLAVGDIVLLTSAKEPSGSVPQCFGGVYNGNGSVLMTGKDGSVTKQLLSELKNMGTLVVLRHRSLSGEAAVSETLREAKPEDKPGSLAEFIYAPVGIHSSVCSSLPDKDKNECAAFKGKLDLKTASNDRFVMAFSLLQLLESAGLPVSGETLPDKPTDQQTEIKHNGQLQYAGHLQP